MKILYLLVVLFICFLGPVLGQDPPGPPVGFVSEEFGFKAVYPAQPKQRVEKDGGQYFSVSVGGQLFAVSVQRLTRQEQKDFESKLADSYATSQAAFIEGSEGKLLTSKEMKIGGLPAREFTHTVGTDWQATTRMVFSNGTLYYIIAVTLVEMNPYKQQIADRFVQSLQLIPRKAAK